MSGEDQQPTLHALDFETDDGLGPRACIGLIVLQTDQTLEQEVGSLLSVAGVALYHTRIANQMEVNPATLRQMEADLPTTAALLPEHFGFDAIGYGCTSAATLIGESRVEEILQGVHPGARISNPITACKAALAALNLHRIALVTPYIASISLPLRENLAEAGFKVTALASFNQSDDFIVARITPQSIKQAILDVGLRNDCDGVFVSCTSLRVLSVIEDAERDLGKPVLSSNQVLAWHLMRQCGVEETPSCCGRLFTRFLPASHS